MKKDKLKKIRPLYDEVKLGNKVFIFFALLAIYYILNLLTSDVNSGMSGGLEAERNPVNQVMASLLIVFVLYHDINSSLKTSYFLFIIVFTFLAYTFLRNYFCYLNGSSNNFLTSFIGWSKYAYWGGGLIFAMKFFKSTKPDDLKRLIQMMVSLYLVYATYRLFTQKAILFELGISAGINSVGQVYMLVPLVMLTFKGKTKLVIFIYMAFICVFSAKRQAVVGMAIVGLFSVKEIYQAYFKKHKFLALVIFLFVFFFGSGYIYHAFDDLMKRQETVEENEQMDSGRAELWQAALDGFERSDNTSHWFGGGSGTGKRYIGEYFPIARAAHNGFIEILCDYGYVGLFLYILFFLVLLGYTLKVKKMDDRLIYLSICFSWIFHNVISHPGNMRLLFLAIGIGYIFYKQDLKTSDEGN